MSISGDELRETMGYFATGVTVISMPDGDGVHAMTANAVTSVSLDPPLLLVCIYHKNHSHQLLTQNGDFAVNILDETQETVSEYFATQSVPEEVSFKRTATGIPVLNQCLAYLICEVETIYPGGDHSIFLARVHSTSTPPAAENSPEERTAPLIFYRGDYFRLKLSDG